MGAVDAGRDGQLAVELVWASAAGVQSKLVLVPTGACVRDAIVAALGCQPVDAAVGIWGQRVDLERVLTGGERVEIYPPLLADPKSARRLRAKRTVG